MNELTQVIITGRDQTQAAFASVTSGLGRLQSGFSSLNAAAGALGAAFSVSVVAAWAKETIAAASSLDDLADATGSTVESLSKLSNIAKVSGADFGTIDQAIKKLAVGLAGTDEESGRAGKALAALGISARDPAQAMLEIAKRFEEFRDGPEKAALAVAIFGKAGASLLPILKDMAENQDIAATVTRQQAADAEALEKAWRRLGVESTSLKTALLSNVVPALRDTITEFNLARAAGLGFIQSLAVTDVGSVTAALAEAQQKLSDYEQGANKAASWLPGWMRITDADVEALRKRVAALTSIRDMRIRAEQDAGKGDWPSQITAGATSVAPKVSGCADTKAAKVAVSDYTDEIMRLRQEMLKLSGGDEAPYPKYTAATIQFVKDVASGKKIIAEQAAEMFELAIAFDELVGPAKTAADAWEEYAKAATTGKQEKEQLALQVVKTAEGILAENKALQIEHDTLGLDDNLRQQYITNMQIAEEAAKGNALVVEHLTDKLKLLQQQAADRSMITYQENWKNTAREIGDSLTDAFMRAFESGKDFGKSLVNSLKSMFSKLVLQPIIQGVMRPLAGSITGGVGGMLGYSSSADATSFGGFGNVGSSLGGLGSFFSQNPYTNSKFVGPPTEGQYYVGEAGTYLGAGLAGYGIGSVAHELAGNNRNQAGMQGGATVGAMIGTYIMPGIGTVIGALIGAIAGSFIKSGGGPKVGGYGAAGNIVPWNRTDQFVGSSFQPGHFTPNQEDGAMADAARSWIKNFDKLVTSYGGTKGRGGFDIGRYSDPKGTTDNALGVRGFVNGQQSFNYWNNSLGRDDAAMQTEIALVTQRALIAGLQKSDIASQISAVFNTLDANALTQGQIDNVLAFADAMQQVIDAIGGDVAADAATTWANSQRSSVEALVDMGKEVIRLADEFDGSTESMQSLATASKSYRSGVEQVLIAIRTVAQQAQAMQGSLVQSIQTAGMSWDQGFSYWTNIADQQAAMLAHAKSPEEVSKISTAYYTALGNAFSAVPAEFQNTYKAPLLGALAEFGDGVEAVLKQIGVDTVAGTESPFAAANKALNDAAGKFDTSAATMSDAASDMKLAAADMKSAVADFRAAMPLQVQVSYADHLV